MPAVNELLDIAKAELPYIHQGEVFLVCDYLKDMNGIEFHVAINCFLAPYFSII
jgi:hypothetical protein